MIWYCEIHSNMYKKNNYYISLYQAVAMLQSLVVPVRIFYKSQPYNPIKLELLMYWHLVQYN